MHLRQDPEPVHTDVTFLRRFGVSELDLDDLAAAIQLLLVSGSKCANQADYDLLSGPCRVTDVVEAQEAP